MKKNLLYVLTLICSMSLFTACSSDDEDTAWMAYQEPTEFAETKLQVVTDGAEQTGFPVTFKATSATAGTLTFSKIVNVVNDFTMDVVLTKTAEGYDVVGEKEKDAGYAISVKGNITTDKMYLEVKTSGYATISDSYSSETLVLTINGTAVDMETSLSGIVLKATAADKINITLEHVVPGIFVNDGGLDAGYVIEGIALSEDADKNTYSFEGASKYGEATISVEGSVSQGVLTLSVDVNIESSIVGRWNVKMNGAVADVIAVVTTPEQKIVLPDSIYKYVPVELQEMITQTMYDQQIMELAKGFLGQYVTYLKSIEFKANGEVNIVYANIGDPTEVVLSGWINYIVKDNKLCIAPNLARIIGMLMPTNTKSYDPSTLLDGAPIPFDYTISGNALAFSVDETVVGPLISFVNQLLPLVGTMMPDPVLLKKIGDIITFVDKTIIPTDEEGNPIAGGAKLQIGLKLTK